MEFERDKTFFTGRFKSMGFAFKGAIKLITTEHSVMVQSCLAVVMIIAGFYFEISHEESFTAIASNKRGDIFSDSFTFYATKTEDEVPEIVCFMIIPKVFILSSKLGYEDYLRLSKNLFQEFTRRQNQAYYDLIIL